MIEDVEFNVSPDFDLVEVNGERVKRRRRSARLRWQRSQKLVQKLGRETGKAAGSSSSQGAPDDAP